jgi:dCTP deaminase
MLGHSLEYVELPDDVSAEVQGRSSFARLGLEIHVTAGFIDPGFSGVITFELYNSGPNPIKLFPGLRIAQLRFFKVEEATIKYQARETTKYKGLLSHNISLQFKDMEMERLLEINKR